MRTDRGFSKGADFAVISGVGKGAAMRGWTIGTGSSARGCGEAGSTSAGYAEGAFEGESGGELAC